MARTVTLRALAEEERRGVEWPGDVGSARVGIRSLREQGQAAAFKSLACLDMRKQVVNMKARLSQVRWDIVLKTAALVYVVTFILGLALSFPLLAFRNSGRLDSQSASQASTFITAFVVIVVTGYGAWWVARRVGRAALLHGFLVGLIVALVSFVLDVLFLDLLTGRAIEPVGLVFYVLMVAAGLLGGFLGSKGENRRKPMSCGMLRSIRGAKGR